EYYRYIVYVSPTQFDTTITAYLTDGSTTVSVSDYSVYAYCTAAMTSDESDELYAVKDLCEAVLNYGYYVEKWLDGSSSIDILDIDLTWTDPVKYGTWDVDLSTYSSTANGIEGKTLALDGEGIFIRLYVSDSSTYTVSSKDIISGSDSSGSYIEFKVPAKEMSSIFSIYRDGVFYTSYSIYSYIKNTVDDENENLSNVCKAIYYYGQASAAYQGWR
ncbi:MAG: hypothetical protein LUF29_09345, partial [Oscillospiraceae bacterium]|nr:hypothetical protein [Oscillospiraceae bacterium]